MSGDKYNIPDASGSYAPMKPELLNKRQPPPGMPRAIPNPLSLFQSKSKPIAKQFRSMDTTVGQNIKEEEARTRWLRPDRLDPTFGIKGDTKEVLIRRSYRRLESVQLFDPVKNVSLEELALDVEKAGRFDSKRYVLVEESRLAELATLESILKEEKARLGDQCAWIMNDYHVDARMPLNATRMAVHNLCDADAKRLAEEISQLHRLWNLYCITNNYDRMDDVLNTKSYLNAAPLALRAMKLQKLREMREGKMLQFERDSMMFEDDRSFLHGAFFKAVERKLDYDRYFVLATRYGHFSEEDYNRDDRPGRRYWIRAVDAAVKFQNVWGMYWAIQRIKRRRGATLFQKIARGWIYYRRWHPLVIFRLKYGKRTYYEFCLNRWKSYNRICVMCKEAFVWYLDRTWFHKTWAAWKTFTVEKVAERNRKLRKVLYGLINGPLVKTFDALKRNAVRNRYIKIKMRRAIGFPHFDMWCDYVDTQRMLKRIAKAATLINKWARMYRMRKIFKAKRIVGRKLGPIMRAIVKCIGIRKKVLAENFLLWELQETEALAILGNEVERKRQQRQQTAISAREKANIGDLKKHLKSKYGRLQMQRATSHIILASKKDEMISEINANMLDECSALHRGRERHDFNLKEPAPFVCVDPNCGSTFINRAQYQNHWRNDVRHSNNNRINEENNFEGFDPKSEERLAAQEKAKKRKYAYPAPVIVNEEVNVEEVDVLGFKKKKKKVREEIISIVNFHLFLTVDSIRGTFKKSLQKLMFSAKPGVLNRQQAAKKIPMTSMQITGAGGGSGNSAVAASGKRMSILGGLFSRPKIAPTHQQVSTYDDEDKEDDPSDDDDDDDDDDVPAFSPAPKITNDAGELTEADADPYTRNIRNALDMYSTICEWKRFPTTAKEHRIIAIHILDHFLKAPPFMPVKDPDEKDLDDYWENYDLDGYNTDDSDDSVLREEKATRIKNRENYRKEQLRKQEIAMRGDTVVHLPEEDQQWWNWLLKRLEGVKAAEHRGFYKQVRLNRTIVRMMMGMPGQQYNEWTTEAVLPPNIFDRLQWVTFRFLFYYCTEKYPHFKESPEFLEFLEHEKAIEERRLQEMYWRAKDVRLQSIEKWVKNVFMEKHLALYRKGEECAIIAHKNIVDAVVEKAIKLLVDQKTWMVSYDEQVLHESTLFITEESFDWAFDALFDELYHFYTVATVTSLMDNSTARHRMMVFAGLRENTGFDVGKKLLVNVDLKASSASMLDMLGGDDEEEENPPPADSKDTGEDESKGSDKKDSSNSRDVKEKVKVSITASKKKADSKDPGPAPKPSAAAIAEMKKISEGGSPSPSPSPSPVPSSNVINPVTNKFSNGGKNGLGGGVGSVPGDKSFHLSPTELSALKRLQNVARGILARNRVRKIFVKTFVKKYDMQYACVYYANVKDGSSSWTPPALYKHLFQGKSW